MPLKNIVFSVLLVFFCLASGFDSPAGAENYSASNFSAQGRKLQPAPTDHKPGKDNGPGKGTHNAGVDCGLCHRPEGKAANYVFTMSGTLYEDRAARRALKDGEVILQDINGKVISMTSNEAGNFWTYTPIGSNPRTVASHGGKTEALCRYQKDGAFIPADPADSRTWQYKAWTRDADRTIAMVTIAPVGGSTDPTSRMSCNMHHAALGSRGGLWASKKATLPSYPDKDLSFRKHVLPVFVNKCVPCHIPGATTTRLVTESDLLTPSTTVDFSGNFDLTSYGGSTVQSIVKRGPRDLSSSDKANPDASPFLATPASAAVHPAGRIWDKMDADYRAIKQWIVEGTKNN
jgi:hypothetical protein